MFGLASVSSVAFSPLGGLLATGSLDRTTKICMLLFLVLVEIVILMLHAREMHRKEGPEDRRCALKHRRDLSSELLVSSASVHGD